MDAPVGDERHERAARDFAAEGVERRQHHRVRRVVQKELYTRRGLKRPHVAPVAPHDAPLHLGVGQRHRGRRQRLHMRGGAALHRVRHNPGRQGLALLARGLLDAAAENRGVGAQFGVRPR